MRIEIHAPTNPSGNSTVYFSYKGKSHAISKASDDEIDQLLTIKQKYSFFEGNYKFNVNRLDVLELANKYGYNFNNSLI